MINSLLHSNLSLLYPNSCATTPFTTCYPPIYSLVAFPATIPLSYYAMSYYDSSYLQLLKHFSIFLVSLFLKLKLQRTLFFPLHLINSILLLGLSSGALPPGSLKDPQSWLVPLLCASLAPPATVHHNNNFNEL